MNGISVLFLFIFRTKRSKNPAFSSAVDGIKGDMASTTIPGSSGSLMGPKRWYFTEIQLKNTPTVRNGLTLEKELSYRQQAANFIQDMGQRLEV